ncbi:hypothetical protein Fcan01_09518 [Folsomia candida]|uniref:Uncharacterized protein n=1 Tax=Folsomia candida TaxID=158441 RepID=A0A226EE49_FOLCA|nr:hypothetical protein Fcan01_09518 [Folsomia candida]
MHHVVLQTGVGNRWVSGCGMDDPFPTIPAAAWSTSISSDSVRAAIRGVATWAEFDTRTAPSYDYCQPFHCLCTHWYHHEPRGLPGHHRREAELTLFLLPFAASAESKLQIMEQNGALRMPHITRLHFLSHPRQPFLFSFPTFVLVIIVIMTSRRTKSNNLRCMGPFYANLANIPAYGTDTRITLPERHSSSAILINLIHPPIHPLAQRRSKAARNKRAI